MTSETSMSEQRDRTWTKPNGFANINQPTAGPAGTVGRVSRPVAR
jgi:hypothetical protein